MGIRYVRNVRWSQISNPYFQLDSNLTTRGETLGLCCGDTNLTTNEVRVRDKG